MDLIHEVGDEGVIEVVTEVASGGERALTHIEVVEGNVT